MRAQNWITPGTDRATHLAIFVYDRGRSARARSRRSAIRHIIWIMWRNGRVSRPFYSAIKSKVMLNSAKYLLDNARGPNRIGLFVLREIPGDREILSGRLNGMCGAQSHATVISPALLIETKLLRGILWNVNRSPRYRRPSVFKYFELFRVPSSYAPEPAIKAREAQITDICRDWLAMRFATGNFDTISGIVIHLTFWYSDIYCILGNDGQETNIRRMSFSWEIVETDGNLIPCALRDILLDCRNLSRFKVHNKSNK